jgi:hypothetical protein
LAANTTVPAPVMVSVDPLTVPGPDTMLKVIARPDVEEADSAMGATP